jgi:hypothetical protein
MAVFKAQIFIDFDVINYVVFYFGMVLALLSHIYLIEEKT